MRRVIAVILTIILASCAAFPSFAVSAPLYPSGEIIYTDNSSGEMVVRIQMRLRELGYLNYKPTGVYRAMTVAAVKAFQERCGAYGDVIAVDGRMGSVSIGRLFEFNAPRSRIPDSVHMPKGPTSSTLQVTGTLVSWMIIKQKLVIGREYVVTDCNTGMQFSLQFTGGENHAEMELASEAELENFMYICGDEYNFLKRPIIIEIEGQKVAASIQCWPHGSDSNNGNGMDGHVCVFFAESLSHVGSLPDVEHNANVYSAAGR